MTVSLKRLKDFFANKTVRRILICLLALALLLAAYFVFVPKGEKDGYVQTAREARLVSLLKKLDDIDDVTVMVTEENGNAVGAVIVFEGRDGLLLRMHLMEITAGALNIEKSAVHIYPAEG